MPSTARESIDPQAPGELPPAIGFNGPPGEETARDLRRDPRPGPAFAPGRARGLGRGIHRGIAPRLKTGVFELFSAGFGPVFPLF